MVRFYVRWLRFAEKYGLLDQVVAVRHALSEDGFLKLILLGLTAETDVRNETPFIEWVEALIDSVVDAFGHVGQAVASGGFVREGNPKEECGFATPIVIDVEPPIHNFRRQKGAKGV